MKKKLIFWNSLILVLALAFTFSFGIFFAHNSLLSEAESHLISLTHAYKNAFDGNTDSLSVTDESVRETILSEDGTVLWDSKEDASKLESHKNREEFLAAIEGNPKVTIRSSSTFGVESLYYAETKAIGTKTYVIRVALETSSLTRFLTSYTPWMGLITLLALSGSIFAIAYVSSRSLRPLKEIEHNLAKIKNNEPIQSASYSHDELGNIYQDINDISISLSASLRQRKEQEEKLSLLLSSVPNPILAVQEKRIVFANESAKEIFMIAGDRLKEGITLQNGKTYFDMEKKRTFLVSRKDTDYFSLFVLNDITLQVENEKQRKEFVDAASHELKTPLTTIKGFNELIELSVSDPKIKEYSAKISASTSRMLSLIQDMLNISALEEDKAKNDTPPLDFSSLAKTIIAELSPLASEKEVSVSLKGNCLFPMEEKDARLIIKNLLENAILYNVKKGSVTIFLSQNRIEVKDTGIGIPKKDQSRVFERFYRVDKSHSRQNGGTGLGLSIVKHAVNKYGGFIKLDSVPGYGTDITISFLQRDF